MDTYTRSGLTFDVSDHGPADGRVVVALHGFPEDRRCWDGVAGSLAGAGYRVLAPDQRGYSPGARPPARGDYRLPLLADDVLALADRAGAPLIDVVGHDWGAVVAWYLAARHPDRVRTLTALSVPHPAAFRAALLHSSQALHSWYMAAFQVPLLPEWAMARAGGSVMTRLLERSGLDTVSARRYAARAAQPGAMTGPLNWYRALPSLLRQPLGPVAVPTLFVWGAGDRFVTRAAAEGCAAHARGPFLFVPLAGADHWLPSGATEAVAEAVVDHLAAAATS